MIWRCGPTLAVLIILLGPYLPAGYGEEEADLKTAFVYRVCHFVTWPASAKGDPDAPFVIGVIGSPEFSARLERFVAGKRIDGRRIEVRGFDRFSRLGDAHVVFVPEEFRRWTERIVSRYEDKPALTIGEYEDFALRGGAVSIYVKHDTLVLDLNHGVAARRGLSFSPKLLAVADAVIGKP